MLVLTRRQGESIAIGDDVTITVLEIRGGQVRLGIVAPSEITVLRSEILDQGPDQDQPPVEPVEDRTMVPTVVTIPEPGEA